jgi:hypothetical protein
LGTVLHLEVQADPEQYQSRNIVDQLGSGDSYGNLKRFFTSAVPVMSVQTLVALAK